jgi:SAM-dependent methyltransferase
MAIKNAAFGFGETPSITDQCYLRAEQYKDASNLNARAQLHQRFRTSHIPWQCWLWERFDLPDACRVLDIGCGPGGLWSQNLERVPAGWRVTLADFSPGILDQARQRLEAGGHGFGYAVADAQALPFADRCFECVIANQVLYHVPDRARALGEIRRVLCPGGRLYAATLGHRYLRELQELLARVGVDASGSDAASEFGLENGRDQLAPYFDRIAVYHNEDALSVTQAEPLIAYALSTSAAAALRPRLDAFRRLVEREIVTKGAIYMPKESGLFEAIKG